MRAVVFSEHKPTTEEPVTEQPLVERVSFRDSDHTYHLDGKRVPSVTTILGNLSKPGLVWWSAKEGAKAALEFLHLHVDDPDTEFPHAVVPVSRFDHVYELIRTAHNNRKQTASAKGNVVHDAVQKYHEDFFTAEPPPEHTPARAAWDCFIDWWKEAGLRCISTERRIVDPSQRYAGRLDMLCEDVDRPELLYVCDLKTSGGIYPEAVYQNAGYAATIEGETEREVAGTKVLWLPEGATKLVVVERDRDEWLEDFEIFNALIRVHGHRTGLNAWLQDIKTNHGPQTSEDA